MRTHVLTEQDFINNPILKQMGFEVGEKVDINEDETTANRGDGQPTDDPDHGDDTGGTNPSPDKPRG